MPKFMPPAAHAKTPPKRSMWPTRRVIAFVGATVAAALIVIVFIWTGEPEALRTETKTSQGVSVAARPGGGSDAASVQELGQASVPSPFPELTGRVVDNAKLLSEEDERHLAVNLRALEDRTTDQVVVVTLPSLQGNDIDVYGARLGNYWGIGTKEKNNGVLLIVAPTERKVRIEVGRGLSSILTDRIAKLIIENKIVPRFREGDFGTGIKDGVGAVLSVLAGDTVELENVVKPPTD